MSADRATGPARPGPCVSRPWSSTAPVAMVLTDADLVIRWVSPAVTPLLGWDPEEVLGTDAADLIHPDDLGRAAHNLGQMLEFTDPEEIDTLVVRIRHKDGGGAHRRHGANLLHDPEVSALLVNLRDVSLQVEAQVALARSEGTPGPLAQHSSDSVFVTTADGSSPTPARRSRTSSATRRSVVGHRPQEYADEATSTRHGAWTRLLAEPGPSKTSVAGSATRTARGAGSRSC